MAARALDPRIVSAIQADWRTGRYSQRDLAEKHKVSAGTAAKMTKGVPKDSEQIVSAGIQYRQGLAGKNEHDVIAIVSAVDDAIALDRFFKSAAVRNVESALSKIGDITDQQEHKNLADTILKGREAAMGKRPDTAIQINNHTTQASPKALSDEDLMRIAGKG